MTKGRDVPPLPTPEPEIGIFIDPRHLKLRHIVALEEAMGAGVKPMIDWLLEHAGKFLNEEQLATYREQLLDLDWPQIDALRAQLRTAILEAGKVPLGR